MPVYEFACGRCGPFEELRRLSETGAPATCPACGGVARRVFSPPNLALLARPLRRALDLEERSAHEPDVADRKAGRKLPHRHSPSPPWVLSH